MVRCGWLALSCVLGLMAVTVLADNVKTTDGRSFTGLIVRDDDSGIVIDAMIHGIRSRITLAKGQIASTVKEALPDGFFDSPKPATRPTPVAAAALPPAALDHEAHAQLDKLKEEIE